VIVLAQLDSDYFKGLEGSYNFDLQFRIETEDDDDNDYIVRSHQNYVMVRSVSTDIELDAGTYSIFMKITATPNLNEKLEELLPEFAKDRREKLAQVGMSYDLAHAKGIYVESEQEKEQRVAREKAKRAADREKERKRLRAAALKVWERDRMYHARDKKAREKREKANARRRARRGSPSWDGSGDDERGSMNAARGGSLDGTPAGAGRKRGRDSKKGGKNVPLRLKSFSGEPITMKPKDPTTEEPPQAAQDVEQASVAAAVADVIGQVNREDEAAAKHDLASNVVQPLDAVIADADAHTAAAAHIAAKPPTPTVQVNGVDAVTDVRPLPTQPGVSSEEAVDDVPVLAGGREDIPLAPEVPSKEAKGLESSNAENDENGIPRADDDDDASIDSFPSFEWHSNMSSSDDDKDSESINPLRPRITRVQLGQGPPDDIKEEVDMGDLEPWNAVCVVGLRVYSLLEGDGVVLEVVRPGNDEEGDGGGLGMAEKVKLDRDDPSKSLVEVEGVKEGAEVEKGKEKGEI
jgi:hypothetical protein